MARAGRVWPILGLLLATPVGAQVPRIHRQIYPSPAAPVSIAGLADGAMLDTVHTADGLTLKGIESPPRDGKPTFLIFHGNESSAMEAMRWFAPLIAQGYGTVAAEYREYGGNPGAAFVIKDAPHAPDGATLAMILEAIAAKVWGDGKTVSVRLPVSVTIAPFAPRS